jgi:hypothetical protein
MTYAVKIANVKKQIIPGTLPSLQNPCATLKLNFASISGSFGNVETKLVLKCKHLIYLKANDRREGNSRVIFVKITLCKII